ncbi:hypothetical protein [Bradyrhizobium elkanii]|uniref:hypothetical protein n=1 Tax=Bradyrhizobium elkanii TaxID=29448 RepID=UPI000423B38F|nr:hypothetical protein [Bradyrhizobium elkanii]
MKAETLYHFTCTARLPWIVATKELRPDRNQIGGFPSPDFLWATTRSQGDRTAAGMQGYRRGVTALVRLTLFAEDFEPWPAITARFPQWTIEHVRQLEAAARGRGETNFECWRARAEPLPLSRIIGAKAKTYTGRWRDLELAFVQHPGNRDLRGIILNDEVYCSLQHVRDGYPIGYVAERMSLAEWSAAS